MEPTIPAEMPVSLAEHIYAAARADMEFGTSLTAAQHHIENLLSAFSHAVCNRDADALGELTHHVTVSLTGVFHPESPRLPRSSIGLPMPAPPRLRPSLTSVFGSVKAMYSTAPPTKIGKRDRHLSAQPSAGFTAGSRPGPKYSAGKSTRRVYSTPWLDPGQQSTNCHHSQRSGPRHCNRRAEPELPQIQGDLGSHCR